MSPELRGDRLSRARAVLALVLALAASGSARAQRTVPNPLVPHPSNRPIFSQDQFLDVETAEPPIEKAPEFTQDKFAAPDESPTYTEELRKHPERAHEESEIEIAKGHLAMNSEQYAEAEKHFRASMARDPRNFVALEYLAALEERRGNWLEAVRWYAKAKHLAPEGRWGAQNFHMGRLYLFMKNYERAEVYLRLAIEKGGHLTAAHYSLGYLYYLQKRYFEAEAQLHSARMRAIRYNAQVPEREMLQSIDYYLGECYARLGFADYAITMLRGTEAGPSWEIRNGAWRVHAELNQSAPHLTLGVFAQVDSNVVLLPVGADLPAGFSSAGSFGTVLFLEGGWQSSPAKPWQFGGNGNVYYNGHWNGTLGAYDMLNFGLDAWGRWWNRADWSFGLKWDFNRVLLDRATLASFQTSQGPSLSATYVPFQRWNWEVGFSHLWNTFHFDLPTGAERRTGIAWIGFFKASLKAPNPRFRPSFQYQFELNDTNGLNWDARTHSLAVEGDFHLFLRTHVIAGGGLAFASFPNHLQGRSDQRRTARLGLAHFFDSHWTGLMDVNLIQNTSSNGTFSYNRTVFSFGMTYAL